MAEDKTKLAVCSVMGRFLDSNDLSDFTIISNGTTWNVHRLVLCMHSDVFQKWCTGSFEETKKRQVDLSDHDPKHIDELVKYLYTFDYGTAADSDTAEDLSLHASMCIIADKYNIEGLKTLSIQRVENVLEGYPDPSAIAPACAVAYDASGATTAIRKLLVSHIVDNHEAHVPDVSTERSEKLEEVMSAYPEFALEVLKALAKTTRYEEAHWVEYECPSCGDSFEAPFSSRENLVYPCRHCTLMASGSYWQKHVADD